MNRKSNQDSIFLDCEFSFQNEEKIIENDTENDLIENHNLTQISNLILDIQQNKIDKCPRKRERRFWKGKNTEIFYKIWALFNSLDETLFYFQKHIDKSITYKDIKRKYRKELKNNRDLLHKQQLKPKISERINKKFCQFAEFDQLQLQVRWSQVSDVGENEFHYPEKTTQNQNIDIQIEKNLASQLNEMLHNYRETQRMQQSL